MAVTVDPNFDFSGYATKYDLKCTDGRTIQKGAFKHTDGRRIPLVWQHNHGDPNNILGYAVLEHREDGVYAYGYFNQSQSGIQGKTVVQHGDVTSMSIYANKLVERNNLVHSGEIRELSLVLSGANPGAVIEHVSFAHQDGSIYEDEEEAIVSMNLPIELKHQEEANVMAQSDPASANNELTVADVVASMDENQKKVMFALIANAAEEAGNLKQSDDEGDNFMKNNVFDQQNNDGKTLSHAQRTEFAQAVFDDMRENKMSFKDAFVAHAGTYGIDNISYLFPDAKLLDNEPSFETRRMGWVSGWMSGTRHIPFSRIKKVWADLTPEAARAKGYVTGNVKVEQVFALLKRTTEPTTVYKKQKLDKDDISDITDFDVVAWMWREMRFMLDEEIARAGLIGDGRTFGTDDDAIDPTKIRPIYGDNPLFVHYLTLPAATTDWLDIMDAILTERINYKGKGVPNLYVTNAVLNGLFLLRDTTNRRMYKTVAELAAELRVGDIIEVEPMEGVTRTVEGVGGFTADLLGIMVNPYDYTYGADKGGQIATYDQFDIDVNQQKYLIEGRTSGSLLSPKTAMVIERKQA